MITGLIPRAVTRRARLSCYIATGIPNIRQHNLVRDALKGVKVDLSYDWTDVGNDAGADDTAAMTTSADAETRAIAVSDFVCVMLPGGRGTHAELGIAIANGIPTYVFAPNERALYAGSGYRCNFYYAQNVSVFVGDLADYIDFVRSEARR